MFSLSSVLSSPFLELSVLATLAVALRRLWLRPGPPPAASGAIVMAGGIAALDALQQVPFPIRGLTQLGALCLIVIWFVIARSYVQVWVRGRFSTYLADPVDSFAIGTWVAGTSVLGQTILLALPGWRPVVAVTWLLTLLLWLWFVTIVVRGFHTIAANPAGFHATGRILLSTVSTQSMAILTISLLSDLVPRWLLSCLVVLGYLMYAVGAVLVAERYFFQRGWRIVDDWDNTNCILHGAMSITGLAAILTGAFSGPWIVGTWVWVIATFVVIEAIEVARAVARIRLYGWQRGLLTYHVSQWARNFTFGMFYAFNLHLHSSLLVRAGTAWLLPLRSLVAGSFQYVVIGLLLFEAALFAVSGFHLWYDIRKNEKGVMGVGTA